MRISLKKKVAFIASFIAIFLSLVALAVSGVVISRLVDTNYREKAAELTHGIAIEIDDQALARIKQNVYEIYNQTTVRPTSEDWGSDDFNEYVAKFEDIPANTKEFAPFIEILQEQQDIHNVDCFYFLSLNAEEKTLLYLLDADKEEPCPVGTLDPVYEMNYMLFDEPNQPMTPYVTNTEEYGWLVTAGYPVVNKNTGEVVAYLCCDISMNQIRHSQMVYVISLGIILAILTLIIVIITLKITDSLLITPITELSNVAKRYCTDNPTELHHGFEQLQFNSNDEIQDLGESMKQMESDINNHLTSILLFKDELNQAKIHASEMDVLAYKDGLTGVYNRAAYIKDETKINQKIAEKTARFGVLMSDLDCLKQINDTYGHEYGDIALQTFAQIVCSVFAHSPVYRYGGDEFVIILENNDYDKVADLVIELKQQLEENAKLHPEEPWKKVSAAVGYALYNPKSDKSLYDVFSRADLNMYNQKKASKKGR